jgi:iron complex outermembrane recepter protein
MPKIVGACCFCVVVFCTLAITPCALADEVKQSISIPAGDLGPALQSLARQTGAEIAYRPEQVRGLKTEGVNGNLSTREALERLLKGTTLVARTDSSGAILITPAAVSTPATSTQPVRDPPTGPTPPEKPRAVNTETTSVLQEVVVTATKRSESAQEIPISLTALTGQDLEAQGALNFDQYARTVPGLSFTDTGVGRERIAIRGIDATVGSTVVGYYLDETPIPDSSGQSLSAENVGFDPELIDVNRVEVLRGPQGTTFGAGSMGGTIRIIPNEPDPTKVESSVKADVSHVEGSNGPSQTYSGTLNLPIVEDRLAVRLASWFRDDEGFIERQIATPASHLANVEFGTPIDFVPVGKVPASDVVGGRVAVRFLATDSVALEASVFSDQQHFQGYQDITTGPQNPTNALVQNFLFNVTEQNHNRLTMSNLKLTGAFRAVDLVASVSYTRRLQSDYEETAAALESQGFTPMFSAAPILEVGRDDAFAAEVRLSSHRGGDQGRERVNWLVGLYDTYQKGWVWANWSVPGFTEAFESISGPIAGNNLYSQNFVDWIRQTAGFGEIEITPIDRLKLTGGVRWFHYSRIDSTPEAGYYAGAPNSASTPDPYTYPTVSGTADRAVYKGVLSWQQSKDMLYYLQAAEGFRGGFGAYALPDICQAQVRQLGFNPGQGEVAPDQLWNYEAGIKSDWLDDRLRVNVDVYQIDWTNVQQSLFLNCGSSLLANFGSVRNRGGELEIDSRPVKALSLGVSFGFVHSALQQDIFGVPGTKGLPLPDVPKITSGAFVEYELPALGEWTVTARADYSYTGSSLSQYAVGASFSPDLGALSLLGVRVALRRDNFEAALYGHNLLNDIERTYLERDVSFEATSRLRYSVNTPRTFGLALSYKF